MSNCGRLAAPTEGNSIRQYGLHPSTKNEARRRRWLGYAVIAVPLMVVVALQVGGWILAADLPSWGGRP